jgi:hypothetical protein
MVTKTIAEPTNVTGVTVVLQATDPNGNFVTIGTATSDQSGVFKKLWTPEVTGEYRITAKFAGTQSYGESQAQTAIGITNAPSTQAPPQYPAQVDNTLTIVGMGIAIMIVVAIVGLMVLRKK